MSTSVERFTAGSRGTLWGYGQGEWVRYSDYEQLQSRLAQVEQQLANEKRLRAELKQIAQIGISEVSSVGTALKDIALIDFRSRAIQLCKDKAAEYGERSRQHPYSREDEVAASVLTGMAYALEKLSQISGRDVSYEPTN